MADVDRVLSAGELNRALLARQLLLERADVGLGEMLERVGGIQAQYAPAIYVGAWSRMRSVNRGEITAALGDVSIVQGTLMRVTIHAVSRGDYWPLALAIRRARRRWWLRTRRGVAGEAAMASAARRLRRALAGGPLARREIEALIGRELVEGVGLWVDLVRVPPSGTWERRRADRYELADRWVGPSTATPAAATRRLVERYVGGFGPAPVRDIATWAGTTVGDLAPTIVRMGLRRFLGPAGEQLVDLPDAPLPAADTPAPVRFLPVWDASLLVHARRTGVLPEAYRPRIFTSANPASLATVLVDGAVAGCWREDAGRITVEPFHRLDAATRRAVAEEADRLAAFSA